MCCSEGGADRVDLGKTCFAASLPVHADTAEPFDATDARLP